jgi:hypothetical protein
MGHLRGLKTLKIESLYFDKVAMIPNQIHVAAVDALETEFVREVER